jgi:hypothetical protein
VKLYDEYGDEPDIGHVLAHLVQVGLLHPVTMDGYDCGLDMPGMGMSVPYEWEPALFVVDEDKAKAIVEARS